MNSFEPEGQRREIAKKYYEKNRIKFALKRKVSLAGFNKMLNDQFSSCMICGAQENLEVDVDTDNAEVRDLLCKECIKGLESFRNSPSLLQEAMKYLRKHLEKYDKTAQ